MTSFNDALANYDRIHRNSANRLMHAIGIPTIIFPLLGLAGLVKTPVPMIDGATAIIAFSFVVILRHNVRAACMLGLASGALKVWAAMIADRLEPGQAMLIFGGMFVVGWIIQFVGHAFERQPPEFGKSPLNLLIGPLFVLNELFRVLPFEPGKNPGDA